MSSSAAGSPFTRPVGTRLPRQRLGEQVASLLLASILLHEYLPGQRLPTERELCLKLGVNRTAVREGLRWLEHQRYLEVRRGKYGGAFVLQPGIDVALERLRGSANELRQLFEYRLAVEPVAAALAAQRAGEAELAQLRELHAAETPEVPRDERRALDVAFHEVIAVASRNDLLVAAVRDIRVRLAPGLDLVQGPWPARRAESRTGHERLIAALTAGDASAARDAMHEHVAATELAIRGILARHGVDLGTHEAGRPGEARP
jgi:GntR family transcriptional repressor for pyruvate dehydrogenase complex